MPEYALILLGILLVSVFIHIRFRVVLWKSYWQMFIVYSIMTVVLVVWDQYAIWRGLWSYGRRYLLGIYVGYMPVEDIGFLYITSYFGLVIYKLVERFSDKKSLR